MYQRAKYELYSKEKGLLELTHDPIGWDEDTRTIERSAQSESFFTKFSNNLRFIREGANYIRIYINAFGTSGEIICRRFEVNPQTDLFEIVYEENLDLESYELEDDIVSIGFLSGGLNNLIKSNFDDKFELHRETSIDGDDIGKLSYDKLGITGRKLFLESFLENKESFTHLAQIEPTLGIRTIEFVNDHNVVYESDDLVKSVIGTFDRDVGTPGFWTFRDGQQFYGPSDRDKILNITFKGNPQVSFTTPGNRNVIQILATGFTDGTGQGYVAAYANNIVISQNLNVGSSGRVPYEKTITVNLKEGQVLALMTTVTASANRPTTYIEDAKGTSIFIEEDSEFVPTQSKVLTYKKAIERTLQIITGKDNVLKSDYFTTGIFKDLLFTSGILLREFPETTEDNNGESKTNGITTSLKQLLSIKAHTAIGWGVERINNQEFFRVEPLEYFFPYKTTIKLKGKFCPKISIAKEYIYGSIAIGNQKSGKYEEQQGLFETNALTRWTTANTKTDNKLELFTDIRTDLIGMEYARREAYNLSPTKDTKYDLENFALHAIDSGNGIYRLRVWQDDFATAPTQVYDPDSAGNLLLSPLRSLERHGWYLNASLYKYPNEFVRYSSTEGNSKMISQLPGEVARGEDQSYLNSDLRRARFVYEYLDFDYPNTFEIKKQLNGFYKDNNNNKIPNYSGLVEFTNEDDQVVRGWILKSTENKTGSFRLIKANR